MGTLPKRARKRLRVVDDATNIADIDMDRVDFDADGKLCVVDTVPAPETSAERAAEIAERRRVYRNAYVTLKPAALAAYEAMRDALDGHGDALGRRLTSKRSDALLISVRMPDDLWVEAFHGALKVLVTFIACTDPDVETSYAVAVPQSDRWSGGEYSFQPTTLMRDLMDGHVFMLHGPQVAVQPSLAPLVDVALDLSEMSARYLSSAVRRAFDLDEAKPWLGPPVLQIKPQLFDAACARAADWTGVAPILNRLVQAEFDDNAQKAAAEKAEKDKKTTSSSAKSGFRPEVMHPTSPTLDTLHGYGAFGAWAKSTAADVAAYRAGRLDWQDVDGGCLVEGPPGTGKTFGAKALAATCGLPFLPVSFAQWSAAGRSYQGDIIAAMRATFAAAAEAAPCILFIDEFDSLPRRGASQSHDDYWVPIVNALLECLDGTTGRPGIIVIAACNNPDGLDPALVRSGRLDRRFRLSLPDEPSLLGMMGYHLPGADVDALAPAATVLAGSASAADVARIAREARRAARREDRAVTEQDILAIAIPPDTLSPRDRRLVAVHEAGHAVAAIVAGRMPDALSIVSVDGAHGGVRVVPDLGMGRLADFENEAIARLAGRAAEEVLLGEPSAGAETDLQVATSLVVRVLGTTGLGGRLTHGEKLDGHAVEGRLRDLYGRALRLVGEHRRAVEALADLALERRVLGRAALVEFAREHGLGGTV